VVSEGVCGGGFAPRVTAEVDSLSLLLGTVSSGGGVGLLPGHARKLPHAGCVFVALAAPVPTAELLVVLPKEPVTVEVERVVRVGRVRGGGQCRAGWGGGGGGGVR